MILVCISRIFVGFIHECVYAAIAVESLLIIAHQQLLVTVSECIFLHTYWIRQILKEHCESANSQFDFLFVQRYFIYQK